MSRVTIAQIYNAIQLERENPQRALKYYKELEVQNRTFYPDILVASIIFPIIGASVTYFAVEIADRFQTLIAFLLLCLSFGPAFTRFTAALVELGFEEPPNWVKRFTDFLAMPFLVMLGDGMQIAMICILAISCTLALLFPIGGVMYFFYGPPFIWPLELPILLTNSVAGFFLLFWMGFTFSDLSFREMFREPFWETLSVIPVGITLKMWDTLQLFGTAILGLIIVGAGPLGIIYDALWQMLLYISVTGFLLGINISRIDDPKMRPLITLGISRTHLALGHTLRARYLALDVMSEPNTFEHDQLNWLARIQLDLLSPSRNHATLQELAQLSVESPNNLKYSNETWPWRQAMVVLQNLAIQIEHKKSSFQLITAVSASSVIIIAVIGGISLAYLANVL